MKLNEDILWDLIDGNLSPEEEKEVRQQLSTDNEWQKYYDSIVSLDDSLRKEMRPSKPSIHFTDGVMDAIHHYKIAKARKGFHSSNINLKGLLLTIAGVVIGGIILSQGLLDFSLLEYTTLTPDKLQTPYMDATPLMDIIGSSALVKGFLFLDAILAIFLVERFLFRPMARS